jgi:N utilization substance protein A
MEAGALIESFSEFAKTKNIDRPTMLKVLEDVFRTMIRKKYEDDSNFDVIINTDKGDLEIWMYREIVPDDYDDYEEYYDHKHILISDAKKIEPDFEIGEQYAKEIKMEDFGRRIVQTARQTLIQRIKDLEKDILFQKYKELVGEIIVGEVYQVLGREIVVQDAEKQELTLPKAEQIYKDRYKKGDQIRAVIHRVEMINGNPKIILSRISPVFIERLLEGEVPEVYEGVITIRKVVREPGERAKVAVESYDDRIDPVGACVGMKGSRIHSIVRELCNENIDVINYTDNTELYISRALSPAKISSIKVDEKRGRASVFLKRDQVSLAIGKNGQNIKLASRLVDLEIDVFRDTEEEHLDDDDVEMSEFEDAIEAWIIEELHRIGLDTARSVLAVSREDLVRRTELEEETVDFVLDVLKKELDS